MPGSYTLVNLNRLRLGHRGGQTQQGDGEEGREVHGDLLWEIVQDQKCVGCLMDVGGLMNEQCLCRMGRLEMFVRKSMGLI
jgi:hypothetical protein